MKPFVQAQFGPFNWCPNVHFYLHIAFIWSSARSHSLSCMTHFLFETCFSELRAVHAMTAWRITSDLSKNSAEFMTATISNVSHSWWSEAAATVTELNGNRGAPAGYGHEKKWNMVLKFYAGNPGVGAGVCELLCAPWVSFDCWNVS